MEKRDKITERLIKMANADRTQEACVLRLSRKITKQKIAALREEIEATEEFSKVEFSEIPKGTIVKAIRT